MRDIKNWSDEEKEYIIENFGKLPIKTITQNLGEGVTENKVRSKAAHLRSKGRLSFKHRKIKWSDRSDPWVREILSKYGKKPTHKLAKKLGIKISTLWKGAQKLGIHFKGNSGKYTIGELAEFFHKDEKAVRRWKEYGLAISNYAKDGLTDCSVKKSQKKSTQKSFHALIDLDDLKKFIKLRPEAVRIDNLEEEVKQMLELDFQIPYQKKKVQCKVCPCFFWTDLYNDSPTCPKCGRKVSKWAIAYQ